MKYIFWAVMLFTAIILLCTTCMPGEAWRINTQLQDSLPAGYQPGGVYPEAQDTIPRHTRKDTLRTEKIKIGHQTSTHIHIACQECQCTKNAGALLKHTLSGHCRCVLIIILLTVLLMYEWKRK